MNTTDPARHQHERRLNAPEPTKDHSVQEDPEKAGTPEAVQAARVAQRNRSGKATIADSARRARGVEWVRPTDLLARRSATVAGRGIDFEVELARRTRKVTAHVTRAGGRGLGKAATVISERARRLPDVSEFGRGNRHQSWVSRSGIGLG
ncbi:MULTISPECIES: hypothetical protein [Micrococcales]|uniref:Uncharacterized protein n=1 Tax=Candidatus Ruania gallistercoris TaxID=2838746 RepID=A0A9D2EF81_9MICO|nr:MULTISPECIES: hypothetical protein [Micrococcales]MDZ5079179.1 hypothetical protein [Nesterenkonia sp. HG001]HIZ36703.1 hypothetical protein [Candidatus Ruania gallistercoris]